MISREDQAWTNVVNCGGGSDTSLFEIAISLGRIADMLAEMNGYQVEYGEHPRAEEAHDAMPVRHGKWIDETFKPWGLVHHPFKCNLCGDHAELASPFCPNCGARMDAE